LPWACFFLTSPLPVRVTVFISSDPIQNAPYVSRRGRSE
jgi:hypothetical protein